MSSLSQFVGQLHRQGDEITWWDKVQIDPLPVALGLWQRTRFNAIAGSEGIVPTMDMSFGTEVNPRANAQSAHF